VAKGKAREDVEDLTVRGWHARLETYYLPLATCHLLPPTRYSHRPSPGGAPRLWPCRLPGAAASLRPGAHAQRDLLRATVLLATYHAPLTTHDSLPATSFPQAIMPNSRLIVLPSPYDRSNQWDMQLLLAPRQQAVVGLVLAGCLLALGLIIFTLEIRERVQDAAEKKLVVGAHVIGVQDPTVRVVRRTS